MVGFASSSSCAFVSMTPSSSSDLIRTTLSSSESEPRLRRERRHFLGGGGFLRGSFSCLWGNAVTVQRNSAHSSGVPWYIQMGICMPPQLVITHCRVKMLTFGANRLNSSTQLCKTLRGHTMRKGTSTRTRRYAINAIVWMVCKTSKLNGACKLRRRFARTLPRLISSASWPRLSKIPHPSAGQ